MPDYLGVSDLSIVGFPNKGEELPNIGGILLNMFGPKDGWGCYFFV